MTEHNEEVLLGKFKEILSMSLRVKKSDVAAYLGITEVELFPFLVKWRGLGFKLDGEDILNEEDYEGDEDIEEEEGENENNEDDETKDYSDYYEDRDDYILVSNWIESLKPKLLESLETIQEPREDTGESFVLLELGNYYMQYYYFSETEIHVEIVSNRYLPVESKLEIEQIKLITELGFKISQEEFGGNFGAYFPIDYENLLNLSTYTFVDIFDCDIEKQMKIQCPIL